MLHFFPGSEAFAIAGVIAATAPVIIHLFSRRRYRVVAWAAMGFLREAVLGQRRTIQLRDLLLLALRSTCLVLFGLALARPFVATRPAWERPNAPLHAVLVIDNSMSMGYKRLGGALLDEAKARSREFIEDLPEGSRISVIPMCGSGTGTGGDAYRTSQDAREAVDRIEVVDRGASAAAAVELALTACRQTPELPTKRVVLIGDQQRVNWPAGPLAELEELAELQVVALAPEETENTWIDDFRVQDAIADLETPALFCAVVRHEGRRARPDVAVTLSIDGVEVQSKVVRLEPGQRREVTFEYRLHNVPAEEGKPVLVPACVGLPPDRLKEDDTRWLAVPVVSSLPVVFVDQFGSQDENPRKNRYGETRLLRRLLAPMGSRVEAARQLVQVRHVRIEQLDRRLLEDVRLVVIAGVAQPGAAVPLLREFVEQGGQLVIAAGAQFDAAAWTRQAWLEGAGVLPAPLEPHPIGQVPQDAASAVRPFFLAPASLAPDCFHLAGIEQDELNDLYTLPCFFKAVVADVSPSGLATLVQPQAGTAKPRHQDGAIPPRGTAAVKAGISILVDAKNATAPATEPGWLTWPQPQLAPRAGARPSQTAMAAQPRVLAAFDNRLPFLVERSIGRGHVLFVASGLFSPWNTLPKTNAIILFDRILRSMLDRTFPARNFDTTAQITLPVADRGAGYQLTRPDGSQEPLAIDALGAELDGVTIRGATRRGIYRVAASALQAAKQRDDAEESAGTRLWETLLAVNGPSRESDLTPIGPEELKECLAGTACRWIARGEPISLEGARIRGRNLWQWIIGMVLVGLVAELLLVARSAAAASGKISPAAPDRSGGPAP